MISSCIITMCENKFYIFFAMTKGNRSNKMLQSAHLIVNRLLYTSLEIVLVAARLDFRKVLRTISGSGAPAPHFGISNLARAFGARFIRYIWFISGVSSLFSFFIVPIYCVITKNISESTCAKSTARRKQFQGAGDMFELADSNFGKKAL